MPKSRGTQWLALDNRGVLLPSPHVLLMELFHQHRRRDQIVELLVGKYGSSTANATHPWMRLERGELSWGKYLSKVSRSLIENRLLINPISLKSALSGPSSLVTDPYMVATVKHALRNGVNIALLTNGVPHHEATWQDSLRQAFADHARVGLQLGVFTVLVDSWRCGLRKPESKFFLYALNQMKSVSSDLDPQSVYFVDDMQINLDAARATCGWNTVQVDARLSGNGQILNMARQVCREFELNELEIFDSITEQVVDSRF